MPEVLAARRKVRLPPSEDGGAAQRGHWHSADDGGAVGEGVDSLPMMGVEEAAMECTRRPTSRGDAAEPLLAVSRGFVGALLVQLILQ